jgi:hypothetical protein
LATADPADTGVRSPAFDKVATDDVVVDHVPPLVAWVSVRLDPMHTAEPPPMAVREGPSLTVTAKVNLLSLSQPLIIDAA